MQFAHFSTLSRTSFSEFDFCYVLYLKFVMSFVETWYTEDVVVILFIECQFLQFPIN